MNLTPIKSIKTYEAITNQLKQNILDGKHLPGSKLPSVRLLSEQLGVGQSAVREALSALKTMGLITIRQGEGTFVNEYDPNEISLSIESIALMSPQHIRSLLELRIIIETGASRLAAQRHSAENLQQLQLTLEEMQQDIASSALGETADWEFHYEVARASQNPFLVSLMDSIGEKIQTALAASRQALFQIVGEPDLLLLQHRAIVAAIAKREGQAAERAMREHLLHVETALKLAGDTTKKKEEKL